VINGEKTATIADRIHMINLVTFFFEKNLRVEDVACGDNFTLFITKEGIFGVGNSA